MEYSIPCALYRGGTSRGLFFRMDALPSDKTLWDSIFMDAIDSDNTAQIDGVGGGISSTSKVCVVGASEQPDADVDWYFYQVGIGTHHVDHNGTCGNLMSAVGAFSIDEGLVNVDLEADERTVRIYHPNIDKYIDVTVPVEQGKAKRNGDYPIAGVHRAGAKVGIAIKNPGGETTGSILPLGDTYSDQMGDITFGDVINPFVFISSNLVGISCTETNDALNSNPSLLDTIELIRQRISLASGISKTEEEAREVYLNIPKVAIVSKPQAYVANDKTEYNADNMDILVKAVSMGKIHKTCPASGLYNIAVMAVMPGTVISDIVGTTSGKIREVRIGHPGGITTVTVTMSEDEQSVIGVGVDRTIRRIMKGNIYVDI